MDSDALRALHDMTDRVVVVTGGTRGIGLALAEAYVACGARVAVARRKPDACAAAEAHLRDRGGDAIGVPTHMGDLDAVAALVERTVEAFGGIDVVVNNAANALALPLGAFTPEAWGKSFDVNVRGSVFLVQFALPHLEASGHAAVLNVVSAGALIPSADVAMYAAGKAAMVSFTRSMAAGFAPMGIRVNALAPGPTDTDMVRNTGTFGMESMARSTMQKRIASADEMVGAALLLTSDAGSYITGQTISVDGGLTSR